MARTAPTVNGTPTFKVVSLRYIDFSGDLRTDSIQAAAAVTDAEIEAFAAAAAAITNADLYAVEVKSVYNAVADSSNAVNAPKDSVHDNLVLQTKTSTNQSKRGFIPAPQQALFVGGTDQIDPTNTDLATYLTALLAIAGAGYTVVGARYTERREINEQVRF